MKFAAARRFSADCAVFAAFGALALGGAIPLSGVLVLLALLLLAAVFEGRLSGASKWQTAFLAILLTVLFWLYWSLQMELAVAMSSFAVALTAQRLLTRKSAADDPLIFLTAFLMLAGGAALTAELFFALCFVAFAVSGTTAMTLSLLERKAAADGLPASALENLLNRRLLFSVVGLSSAALVIAVGLFFIFPRMTAGAFVRKPPVGASSGLSDKIRLTEGGILKDDPRPAMKVRLNPDPGVSRLDIHWRSRIFEQYDGLSWSRGKSAEAADLRPIWTPRDIKGAKSEGENSARLYEAEGRRFPLPRIRFGNGREAELSVDIEVFPAAGQTNALVPEGAVLMERLHPKSVAGFLRPQPAFFVPGIDGQISLSRPVSEGFSYRASLESAAVPLLKKFQKEEGRFSVMPVWGASAWKNSLLTDPGSAASLLSEGVPEDLLALPAGMDERIGQLARRLTESESSLLGKVRAIEDHLASFRYSTEITPAADGKDPLAEFLFVRREGHCELFAAAMAAMLRSAGIPARTVGGFYGGDRADDGSYVVRLAAAHAWAEVYIPGMGFITVDPTPPEGRLPQTSEVLMWISDAYDSVSVHWQRIFVDLSLWDQWKTLRNAGRSISREFTKIRKGSEKTQSGPLNSSKVQRELTVFVCVLIAAAAAWSVFRKLRAFFSPGGNGGVDPAAVRLFRRLEKNLADRGVVRRKDETIREAIKRVEGRDRAFADAALAAADRYAASRFGGRRISRAEESALLKRIRDAR